MHAMKFIQFVNCTKIKYLKMVTEASQIHVGNTCQEWKQQTVWKIALPLLIIGKLSIIYRDNKFTAWGSLFERSL